jgi:hypothetical protein
MMSAERVSTLGLYEGLPRALRSTDGGGHNACRAYNPCVDGMAPLSGRPRCHLLYEIAPLSLMDSAMAVIEPHEGIEAVCRADAERLWRAIYAFAGEAEIASDAVAEASAQVLNRGAAVRDPAARRPRIAGATRGPHAVAASGVSRFAIGIVAAVGLAVVIAKTDRGPLRGLTRPSLESTPGIEGGPRTVHEPQRWLRACGRLSRSRNGPHADCVPV